MNRKKRSNTKKNVILAILFLAIVFMTASYAAYSRNLIINASGKILSDWDVRFTDVSLLRKTAGANEASLPVIADDGLSLTLDIEIIYTDDEIEYEVDITNFSTMFDAKYMGYTADIDIYDDFIQYDIIGLSIGDKILADSTAGVNPTTKTIKVKAYWNPYLINEVPENISIDNPHTEKRTITLTFEAEKPI